MPVQADIKELLAAGAHFGHKTSRWHPKMAPYIHSKREGAHIINLEKTVEALDRALPEISRRVAGGKKVLFVGTKKQMKDTVKAAAESVDMPYVTVRWVGGMLTTSRLSTSRFASSKTLSVAWLLANSRNAIVSLRFNAIRRKSTPSTSVTAASKR